MEGNQKVGAGATPLLVDADPRMGPGSAPSACVCQLPLLALASAG